MLSHTWTAKSCGSRSDHGQHVHVLDGVAYACFGYTAPVVTNRDWWVDGHYIFADRADVAAGIAASLYDFQPIEVRPWTSEDQKNLDQMS